MKIVTPLLAIVFGLSGAAKLAGLDFEVQAFSRWGYPLWFMFAVGAAEVAGAVALWLPRVRALTAAALAALMVGAVATHVLHAEWGMLAIASVILGLCSWCAWQGRAQIATLARPRLALRA